MTGEPVGRQGVVRVRLPLVLLVAGLAAGCGEVSEQTGVVSSVPSPSLQSEIAEPVTSTTIRGVGVDAVETPTSAPVGVDIEIPGIGTEQGPSASTPAAHDPPVGAPPVPMLVFDDGGAYRLGAEGFTRLIDGPVAELTDDGASGVLFQRDRREVTIWWLAQGAPDARDVLVTLDASYLLLEGVSGTGQGREVVYQRVTEGDPESSTTTLRAYRFDDGTVRDLATTGGWEHHTNIAPVTGGQAAGTWMSEGSSGYFLYDIAADRAVLDSSSSVGSDTADLWVVAASGSELVGIGPLPDASGLVTQMGLLRLDQSGAELATITTFPWDNGYWYPSSIYVHDGHVVVSRTSAPDDGVQAGTPLGPIVVDLATGTAITLPFAGNARPLLS